MKTSLSEDNRILAGSPDGDRSGLHENLGRSACKRTQLHKNPKPVSRGLQGCSIDNVMSDALSL